MVASEVKSLATQTTKATNEIGAQITQIQTVTTEAVQTISGIVSTIKDVSVIAAAIASPVEQRRRNYRDCPQRAKHRLKHG